MSKTLVNWQLEAEKIALAFGVAIADLEIENCHRELYSYNCWGPIKVAEDKGLRLDFWIGIDGKPEWLTVGPHRKGIHVYIDTDPFSKEDPEEKEWDFAVDNKELIPYMARGLVNLGFEPELISKGLNYEPTAHEKLEWGLEFEDQLAKMESSKTTDQLIEQDAIDLLKCLPQRCLIDIEKALDNRLGPAAVAFLVNNLTNQKMIARVDNQFVATEAGHDLINSYQ